MEDYQKLYAKEVNKKILNYDELVLKYIVGFNYYQNQYIGEIIIPSDCSLRLFYLWNKIINSNNNDLSNLETLLVLSNNIISNLKNTYPLNYQNISQSLILNLFNVYATLDNKNHLIRN